MHNRAVILFLTLATVTMLVIGSSGQSTTSEVQLVRRAAEALGGRDRLMLSLIHI